MPWLPPPPPHTHSRQVQPQASHCLHLLPNLAAYPLIPAITHSFACMCSCTQSACTITYAHSAHTPPPQAHSSSSTTAVFCKVAWGRECREWSFSAPSMISIGHCTRSSATVGGGGGGEPSPFSLCTPGTSRQRVKLLHRQSAKDSGNHPALACCPLVFWLVSPGSVCASARP